MNDSNPTLRKAHKILKKITKKLGNQDLRFSAQIGVDSSKDSMVTTYAALIAPPRDGLQPITFAAFTKQDFIDKLNDFLKNKISEEQLEVVFHEAQIEANERSIEYHKEEIEKIQNPTTEDDSEQSDETEVENAQ